MNCETARQRWHRRCDENRVDTELDRHLKQCEQCRRHDARMRRVVDCLNELRLDTESVRSHRSAADGVERTLTFGRRRRVFRSVMAIAAMIAFLVTGSLFFQDATPETNEVPHVTAKSAIPLGLSLHGDVAERFIAVAQPVKQPNVQMYWLYPTLNRSEESDSS